MRTGIIYINTLSSVWEMGYCRIYFLIHLKKSRQAACHIRDIVEF